jgi:hypothetical protein
VRTYRAIGYDTRLVDLLDRTVAEIERLAGREADPAAGSIG